MTDEPRIQSVYTFANGQTMVFDQHGKQMPEYQGRAEDVAPKIRAAGYWGPIERREWKRPGP